MQSSTTDMRKIMKTRPASRSHLSFPILLCSRKRYGCEDHDLQLLEYLIQQFISRSGPIRFGFRNVKKQIILNLNAKIPARGLRCMSLAKATCVTDHADPYAWI